VPGPTPHYPPEFKREAVELYLSSERSIPKVAQGVGIADESLRRSIRQQQIDEGEREGLTSEEREELSRLRREVRVLKQEREFLKKAREAFGSSSSRRRMGLVELLLQTHRGGEDELFYPADMQDARGLKERILQLERQAAFKEESRGCRPHREDPRDPPAQQRNLWLPHSPR
jgi:transposase